MSTDKPSTALAPIEPTNMNELQVFAKTAAASGFYGAKNPEQALMIAMSGRDLGLSYTQALRAFHVINGRPAMSADGMVAVCLGHGDVCEYFVTVETSAERCTVETKRRGSPQPQRLTFTLAEAKAAGLSGGNWAKFPAAMLRARAKSALARDVYPDLLMGLYDPDEVGTTDTVVVQEAPIRVRQSVSGPAEVIDAEIVEPPPAKPAPSLDSLGLDPALVDEWLASLGKPSVADRSAGDLANLVRVLEPGKAQRKAFDEWVANRATEAAK